MPYLSKRTPHRSSKGEKYNGNKWEHAAELAKKASKHSWHRFIDKIKSFQKPKISPKRLPFWQMLLQPLCEIGSGSGLELWGLDSSNSFTKGLTSFACKGRWPRLPWKNGWNVLKKRLRGGFRMRILIQLWLLVVVYSFSGEVLEFLHMLRAK